MQSGRARLREWIKRSECNQLQAAEILGFTPVFVSQILSGIRKPGLTNAIKIEQVTGISVESWVLTDVSEAIDADSTDDEKASVSQNDN